MKISLICVSALIASLGHAQSNWDGFGTVRMSIHETGTLTNSKTYTVLRQGSSSRIEGAYPVFGALAKLPHVEIATAKNAFLYVPDLKAALRILDPSGVDRVAATYPTRIKRDLFAAPKELLEKELKKPAKLEGQEKVAGRDCYVLTTTNPKSDVHQEKQWIDTKTGLVLKYQRIEAGKVVYERATTEVAFNPPTLAANFELPLGTLHINGPVSTQAVENLTKLEDATAYQAAMKGIEEKDKDKRAWISRIDPPAGLQHANSDF
jgi:hypothetical protein